MLIVQCPVFSREIILVIIRQQDLERHNAAELLVGQQQVLDRYVVVVSHVITQKVGC